ncbi:ABC transporter permease [Microlunatus endophyticus]|uniref:ABC transporter permease n=1 Tax=Microlunatus endophyticus TaxID=1716077 RepID=A0A917W5Z9_9ACTN|nr:ABC transporter permease [Microlunatus endophyticus]
MIIYGPIIAVLVVLFLIPLGQSIYYSFTDFNGYSTTAKFVGLKNYASVFADPSLRAALFFTIVYTFATVIIVTIVAIPLAVILDQKFRGRNFVRSMLFFPAIPSVAILGLVWSFILSPLASGMLNAILHALFGLAPVPWLSDPLLARGSVIFVAVWAQAGWHAVLYLAYLQSIPRDYYEAAMIDGASTRQQFFYITLPLLMPAMLISQVLLTTAGLKVYDLPFTLTKGGPGYVTFTITQGILQNGLTLGQVGQASALSVLFMVFVIAVLVTQMVLSRRAEGRVL